MPLETTVKVDGLRDFMRDTNRAEKETKKKVRERLKESGEPVRAEWASTLSRYDVRSASKLRVRARVSGVHVEQSLRRTTGLRPDWGRLQQMLGESALERKQGEVENEMEKAADDIADIAEGKML